MGGIAPSFPFSISPLKQGLASFQPILLRSRDNLLFLHCPDKAVNVTDGNLYSLEW